MGAAGDDASALLRSLEGSWETVALHAVDLVRVEIERQARMRLETFGKSVGAGHARVADYLEGLPEVR